MSPSRFPDEYRKVVSRLREARKKAGLTQEEVAEVLGFSQKQVSRIELGDRRVDPAELARLAKLYGKSLKHFLG